MEVALEHLRKELKGLRTGRANPALVEGVMVEAYGTNMRLKEIATISIPEARQILITPFDPSNLQPIVKAIEAANLNLSARAESGSVRIQIPAMDATIREKIAKECKKKGEEAKIVIRDIRRKFNEQVKKEKSTAQITEDEVKRLEKIIQEKTDKYCIEIDKACSAKEKEILEI
jgi:ribosome recycling factor